MTEPRSTPMPETVRWSGPQFTMTPDWVVDVLCARGARGRSALAVWLAVARHATWGTAGGAMPSRQRLAAITGLSARAVSYALVELADAGTLLVEARYDGARQTSNAYTLLTAHPVDNSGDNRPPPCTPVQPPLAPACSPPLAPACKPVTRARRNESPLPTAGGGELSEPQSWSALAAHADALERWSGPYSDQPRPLLPERHRALWDSLGRGPGWRDTPAGILRARHVGLWQNNHPR